MEQNYLTRAAKYLADLRRRKAWKKVVGGLGTAVVFCTVYALILPAITLTRPLTCQLEEHHHTEECYAAVSPISSTTQLPRQTCSLESVYAGLTPDTAHADFVLHTHDASCYLDGQIGGELICTLPEVRAHVHTEACYTTVTELICQLDGAPDIEIPGEGGGHPVTDPDNSNTGTQEPGTGSGPDAGVQEPTAQEIYHHVDSCYENFTEPVCGLTEEPATEGHQHTEACYTREMVRSETPACGLTEEDGHVHTDECYPMVEGTNMVLTCTLPEAPASEGHIHSLDCYRRLICGKQEGELEVVTVFPESAPPLSQGFDDAAANTENTGETVPETLPHVHNATCYIEKQVVACADDQYTPHEHSAACYNENGELICGRVVTRVHVHTAECFVTDPAAEGQPEQQPGQGESQSTICGKQEHVHTDACYEPVQTVNREELDQAWGALIWSNTISEASETVLDAQTTVTSWVDTDALDPMGLEALRAAPAEDLTRFLNSGIGIQVEQDIYSYSKYGPMDPDAKFSILLSWDLTEANFAVPVIETQTPAVPDENSGDPALALLSAPVEAATGSTGTLLYTYTFPQQVVVEDIEKRVLTDSNSGQPVLTYCVQNNVLTVNYAAPVEHVSTSFSLLASWAEGVGDQETVTVQWSNGVFSEVTFASPELTITKTMGEDGLRVLEDGTVWADYTVTVTNSGLVAAKGITLSDTLESEYFTFAQGGMEGGADYSVTRNSTQEDGEAVLGAPEYRTFENYDGGSTIAFPAFDLGAGESCVYEYKALMTAEDRAAVDEIILAEAETLPAGQRPSGVTVRNTATAICHTSKGGVEYTASSQGTYGGPDSKHVELSGQSYTSKDGMFNVNFDITGDAILPPGITNEVLEARGGGYNFKVEELDETDETYLTYAQALEEEDGEESGEEDEEKALSVLRLELRYNGVRLDLADCGVTVTVTPSEALKNYRKSLAAAYQAQEDGEEEEEVLGDDGFTVILRALTLEETATNDALAGTATITKVVEQGSVTLDIETGETAAEVTEEIAAPMMMAARMAAPAADTADTASVAGDAVTYSMNGTDTTAVARSTPDYPTYTVEFFGNVKLLNVIAGTDMSKNPQTDLSIIDTRTLTRTENGEVKQGGTPTNGEIQHNTREKIAFLELNSDGTVKTTTDAGMNASPVQLFKEKTIKFNPNKELNLGMFMILEQFAQEGNVTLDTHGETNYKLNSAIIIDEETAKQIDEIMANSALGESEKEKRVQALVDKVSAIEGRKIVLGANQKASDIKLTTDESKASEDPNTYYLPQHATIRLICDPTSSDNYTAPVVFYDYDITDGHIYETAADARNQVNGKETKDQTGGKTWYANTNLQGINSHFGSATTGRLGFGNGNNFPGMENDQLDGNNINQGNGNNFRKCSFGIVTGLSNGKLQYASGITVPNLFNESGDFTGKTTYQNGYELVFKRVGDTYTMSAVKKNGSILDSAKDLEKLKNTGGAWPTNNPPFTMYSNYFWPMDNIYPGEKANGHDLKMGNSSLANERVAVGENGTHSFLTTDAQETKVEGVLGPNVDHNYFFGMQFNFEFEIPADYIGPLEYCFHGDDDLWLFLDNKLICDIGGVHQSAGEYVDLRDYLPVDGEGTVGRHKLSLFYTERGASGSTCWMQFTLPGIRSVPVDFIPDSGTGTLNITKEVVGAADKAKKYEFNLSFVGGKTYTGEITRNTTTGQSIETIEIPAEGKTFELAANETLVVRNLPVNTAYTIQETDTSSGFETTATRSENGGEAVAVPIDSARRMSGTIKENTTIKVTYTNSFHYSLPETGGAGRTGTIWYTYGALPMMAAAVVWYKRSRKKGGNVS